MREALDDTTEQTGSLKLEECVFQLARSFGKVEDEYNFLLKCNYYINNIRHNNANVINITLKEKYH